MMKPLKGVNTMLKRETLKRILMFGQYKTRLYIYKLSADFERNKLVITRYNLDMTNPKIVWEGR